MDKQTIVQKIALSQFSYSLLTEANSQATFADMDTDDISPPPRAGDPLALAVKADLDPLSVAELHARIATLESEITRTRAKLDHATRHRSIADELFKK